MMDSNVLAGQIEEDAFSHDVSDDELESIAAGDNTALQTGFYWPGSPCTATLVW